MTVTTTPLSPPNISFDYRAQTLDGRAITGSIDAAGLEEAQRLLASMRLRVLEIEPAKRDARARALRGDDFIAFNQQLAHLTSAGLPVEHGLKLIAQDMRSGRLAATIKALSAEMEKGTPLEQAFEVHRERFPPLYSRLVAAGVSAGNLPGVLLNLGRHLELVHRLRAALWRAAAYPLIVLVGVAIVVLLLGFVVIPQFRLLLEDMDVRLPWITRAILSLPRFMPAVAIALAAVVIGMPLAWYLLKRTGRDRAVVDRLALPLPLIGPILRANLAARWCDALRLGVRAGLDLPRAIELAGDAVASPALRRDSVELSAALQSGRTLDSVEHTRVLPASVAAAMALATQHHDLDETMRTLSEMYQQQAEMRLAALPALLTPILILIIAVIIGTIIAALFLPFMSLLSMLA